MKTKPDNAMERSGNRKSRWTLRPLVLGCSLALLASTTVAQPTPPPFDPSFFNEQAKEAVRKSLSKNDLPFAIDTGARVMLPRGKPFQQVEGVTQLYVQFGERLNKAEIRELGENGVKLIRRAGKNAWLAQVSGNGAAALESMPGFLGSEKAIVADKLSPGLGTGKGIDHAIVADGVEIQVRFLDNVSLKAATTELRKTGVKFTPPDRFLFNNWLNVTASLEQVTNLAASPAVLAVREVPGPVKTDNVNAAMYSNVDVLQADPAYLLDGGGVLIGIWDGGEVHDDHEQLTGRVVLRETDGISDHATHVAGTMIASGTGDANAMGMAPAAGTLFSWDFGDTPYSEMAGAVDDDGIVISNNSWGRILGWDTADGMTTDTGSADQFGNYLGLTADWDDVVLQKGLIIVKSSGNDRDDCNPVDSTDCDGFAGGDGQFYDNMGPRSMAKNIIAVGAVNSNPGGMNDITGFSSAGPADDGRIKPDIVADGGSLYSTCVNDEDNFNPAIVNVYCNKGGTSMATPTVSGATALLVQHYRNYYGAGNEPTPEIMKALLVNSAVERGRVGPDYLYGHGLMDALGAAQIIDEGAIRIISDAVDNGETDEYPMLVPPGMDELRVTMTWLDPSGENSDTDAVFQDLDLVLEDPAGNLHYPWTGPGTGNVTGLATRSGPNSVDNVEDAEVTNPQQGVWLARVAGTDVGGGPQNYALVANQDFALPGEPEIEVNFSGDILGTCTGDQVDREIRIFNTGGGDLHVHAVSVAGDSGFEILDIPAQPVIIQPGSHVDYTLRYLPEGPGDDYATVTILSNDADEAELELAAFGQVGEGDLAATMEASGHFLDTQDGQSKTLNLELINEGSCETFVDNVTRVSGSTDFEVGDLPAGLGFPVTLAAGSNFAVPITYTPTPPPYGPESAVIEVDEYTWPDDLTATTHVLNVDGESSEPEATTSGDGQFGAVCHGTVSERTIEVCNTGALNTLHVFSASVVEDDSTDACDDFEIVGNPFPADVSHDFCMPLNVRYTPTGDAGPHSCRLWLVTNDPDESDIFIDLDGETPTGSLSALDDLTFDPTVIQSIGNAVDSRPLPVVNDGECPVEIADVTTTDPQFSVAGLPTLPTSVQPGEQLGDGQLEAEFRPTALAREITGTVEVSYILDPVAETTTSVSADMCGEGVHTGVRILVTRDGVPVDNVESLQILRKVGNTNGKGKGGKTESVDNQKDLPLQSVVGSESYCPTFDFHMEYGTVTHPVQLLPGDYEVTVSIPNANGKGKKPTQTQAFSIEVTDFRHTVVVEF